MPATQTPPPVNCFSPSPLALTRHSSGLRGEPRRKANASPLGAHCTSNPALSSCGTASEVFERRNIEKSSLMEAVEVWKASCRPSGETSGNNCSLKSDVCSASSSVRRLQEKRFAFPFLETEIAFDPLGETVRES